MTLYGTADSLSIDTDEGRFVLVITDDEGDRAVINFHHLALEFYEEVQRELRPWYLEAESARSAVAAGASLNEYLTGTPDVDPDAYALDDPKHPTYHERMVDA